MINPAHSCRHHRLTRWTCGYGLGHSRPDHFSAGPGFLLRLPVSFRFPVSFRIRVSGGVTTTNDAHTLCASGVAASAGPLVGIPFRFWLAFPCPLLGRELLDR